MNFMQCLLCLVMFSCVTACNEQQMLERFASKEDQADVQARIQQLRARDFDAIENDLDPSLKTQDIRATFEKMASVLPPGQPTSVKLVGANRFDANGSTSKNITFEYGFVDKWFLINVATTEISGSKTVTSFHVEPQIQSLTEKNRFAVQSKSPMHYALLVSALVALTLTFYALYLCVRSRLPGKKWPWILFILLGIGKVAINWTTGEVFVSLFSIQLLSASAMSSFYGPWFISASFPLGAIAFLVRHGTSTSRDASQGWSVSAIARQQSPPFSSFTERAPDSIRASWVGLLSASTA